MKKRMKDLKMMSQRQRVGGGSLFERKLTESSPFRQGEQGFGWIERKWKKIQESGIRRRPPFKSG